MGQIHGPHSWASLYLSKSSTRAINAFFLDTIGIEKKYVQSDFHLTVYHDRRRLDGLIDSKEKTEIVVNPADLRLMILAPGGENPRQDIDPNANCIGVRLRRSSEAVKQILDLRSKFYVYETPDILGKRKPSDARRNAFGSHHYQPHITLLKPSSGIDQGRIASVASDLRSALPPIQFDRFKVRIKSSAYIG